jgi:hypothetical protein
LKSEAERIAEQAALFASRIFELRKSVVPGILRNGGQEKPNHAFRTREIETARRD